MTDTPTTAGSGVVSCAPAEGFGCSYQFTLTSPEVRNIRANYMTARRDNGENWRDDPLENTPIVRGYQPKKRGTPTAERFAQRLMNVAMEYRFGSQVALRLERRRARRLRCFYPSQWRGIFK